MTNAPQTVVKAKDKISSVYDTFWELSKGNEITDYILKGGRSSFKSSVLSIRMVLEVMKDKELNAVCLRKISKYLSTSVYEQIKWAIYELGLEDYFIFGKQPLRILTKGSRNGFYFYGVDDPMKLKSTKIAQGYVGLLWFEELAEFKDKDDVEQVKATFVRGKLPNDKIVKTFYSFNPPKNKNAWVFDWIDTKPNAYVLHTTYLDDDKGFLSAQLREDIEQIKNSDERYYRWLYLGEPIGLDGVIYYMFDKSRHVANNKKLHKDKENGKRFAYVGIAVDYGQLNATTFQAFGLDIDDNVIRGLGSYYHSGRESGKQRSPSEYAKDFKAFKEDIEMEFGCHVSYLIIDPSARGLQEEIKRVVPSVKIKQCENAVDLGISRVQKMLMFDKLIFDETQRELIQEMGLYVYDEKSIERGKEVPVKDNDHTMDAMRYYIATLWRKFKYILPLKEGELE